MTKETKLLTDEILQLKHDKDAVILAHYYVPDEVQDIADYVGDSYYLSRIATEIPSKLICFCGVSFMGESAKILNPDKTVIVPDITADCPMAHMADSEYIASLRKKYKDLAVVCYINSTAELKMLADVCVTSANALKIVKNLPNKYIFFIPDENLGRYIASQLPEKKFIFNNGYCHVHKAISKTDVINAKKNHPDALVLVHPECTPDVVALGDYIGSTSGIIEFASSSMVSEFIICTENGVLHELSARNPDKSFYPAASNQICPDMKKITLTKLRDSLKNISGEVNIDMNTLRLADKPLNRMLELAKKKDGEKQ